MITTLNRVFKRLGRGKHKESDGEACLLEAVAYVAGEAWSDDPECVSPVLCAFGRDLNDLLPDDLRQQLLPFIPRLIGTAGDRVADERRSYLALDWLIRTYLPAWLRLVPALVPDADAIAGFRPIEDLEAASEIGAMVQAARVNADAASDTVEDAASDSDVYWATTSASGWDAARHVAAWDAAEDAWFNVAWTPVLPTAWDAAWAVIKVPPRDALTPTVTNLQRSAIDLYDRMISAGDAR